MNKRFLLAMVFLAMLMVPALVGTAQAQFGLPNYGGNTYGASRFDWEGVVDGEVIIRFRQNRAWVENLSGQGVWNDRYRASAPLLPGVQEVNLSNFRGRGEVVVIEQPGRRNNYTACVLVRDRQSGASSYSFALNWERLRYRNGDYDNDARNDRDDRYGRNDRNGDDRYGRNDRNGNDRDRDDRYDRNDSSSNNGRRGLVWNGRVDGRDVLCVRGNRVWFEHQTGAPICEDNANFFDSLPQTACHVNVRKLRGRGNVQLLEAPSAYNNYTAKILVDDRDGGDDRYEFEMFWQ